MFNSIKGIISEKFNDSLRILTGGIEWEFVVPSTDLSQLPDVGSEGRIFTWLYHKENEMRLFGFADEKRRSTFLELLKVDGIGPRGAVKIMGGISQANLESALESEDIARLEAVPGLGKKTAQKMILALKGKLAFVPSSPQSSSPYNELVEVLVSAGVDRRSAIDAINKVSADLPSDMSHEEKEKLILRQAFAYIHSR